MFIACIILVIIVVAFALCCSKNNSEKNDKTKNPSEEHRIADIWLPERVKTQRPRAQPHLEWSGLEYLNILQGPRILSETRKPRYRDGKIVLYHYTTNRGAEGIKRERLIRSSDHNTQQQHRRFGEGVYFTSYSPEDLEPDKLALNCFTNRGRVVTSSGIYSRTRQVVEIEFYPHEIQKLNIFDRDVYIFRGSINLRNYFGRYRIFENPKHPYDPRYSFYVDNIWN